MQTQVVIKEACAVTEGLSRRWKIVISFNLLSIALLLIALCVLFINYHDLEQRVSCSNNKALQNKNRPGSTSDADNDDDDRTRGLRSTDDSHICTYLNKCPAFTKLDNKKNHAAIILNLQRDVTSNGVFMDKWSVANKTSNIKYLAGKILIQVDGFYNVYLQMMPKSKGTRLHSFKINVNKKKLAETSWKCPDKEPCSKATSVLAYLQSGDRITVESAFSNAQWSKEQTVMYMFLYMH